MISREKETIIKFANTAVVYILSILAIVTVFVVDLLTPLGFVEWLGYQLSIYLSYRTLPRKHTFALATASTIFIALGLIYSPSKITIEMALINRSVGIIVLWITTILLVQRKQAEDQIREQADLLDKAHDAIIELDLDHNIIYWNKSAERIYGYTKKEVQHKNAKGVLYDEDSSYFIEVQKSLIDKSEWIGELQQVNKDGKELTVKSSWTIVRNNNEEPYSILIINTDITEKKKIEIQFLRAQRIESIGTLASGIAHDINNILSPIMLSLELLQEKFTDEESKKLIDIVSRSAQRGANLIKQVQLFARGQESEHAAIQVTDLIFEIQHIIKETFPRNIEIQTDLQKNLWTVFGNATQLNQVLMNLFMNARDAMPEGGILIISTENLFIDENYTGMNLDARVGPYIVISISDSGTGIPPEILNRIFEPFFSTKEPGKGTGLGLSIVHSIVKSHGGFINVYSGVGKGTTIRIYLPTIETNETQSVQNIKIELLVGHGESILVVDDEAQIREITKATLEKYGYRVFTANDGKKAIELYSQYQEEIKLVVMDMIMPVMDGQESIQKLRIINPDIKIIAVSGFAKEDLLKRVARTHVEVFLSKPYTPEILLNKIHEVLS